MRKQLVLLFSLLCMVSTAFAQNEEGGFNQRTTTPRTSGNAGKKIGISTKSYNYELSVGPRIGGGLSIMSDGKDLKISDGIGFGFDAGLGLNVRFGGKDSKGRALNGQGLFGIGLELNYALYSAKTKADKNLNLGYFEVPLLLQIYPAYQTNKLKNLYIELGPTFSTLLSKSPDKLAYGNVNYMTKELKGGDVKGTIGVGYRIKGTNANDGLYFNFRYNLGFSKLAGNFPSKISSAEITIGYLFRCVGGKGKKSNNQNTNRNVLR